MKFILTSCLLMALQTLCLLHASPAFAQKTKYLSELDQNLAIKNVTVLPIPDNVSGIYSKNINENLQEMVEFDHQWTYKPMAPEAKISPEQLEENPKLTAQILKKNNVDALVAGRVSKGPSGLTFKVSIYSGKEGLPTSVEVQPNYQGFETKDVIHQFQNAFRRAKNRLPFSGEVLSRKGQLITMNLGQQSGIKKDQELTAIQILKVERHPRSKFITNADEVIMGKIKIEKVDDYLSFGTILSERDPNVVQARTLLRKEDFINYPRVSEPLDPRSSGDLNNRPESEAVYGKEPGAWRPEDNPTFGRISFMGGVGTYNISNNLSTTNVSGRSQLTPSVHLLGEMWLTPQWFAEVDLHQYVARIDNSLAGSSPATLNVSTLETNLQFGYNFLVQDSFWGPKFQLSGGLSKMSSYVDQSTPTAFSSLAFSGWTIGLAGSFPIELANRNPFNIGGKLLYYFYNTSVTESPLSSGGGKPQVSSFAATSEYRISPRLGIRGELLFSLYGATFSGGGDRNPPANSASHQMTTLALGIDYLF